MNVISRYYQIQQHFAASEQDKRAVQRPIHEETSRMAGDPPNGLPRKPPLARIDRQRARAVGLGNGRPALAAGLSEMVRIRSEACLQRVRPADQLKPGRDLPVVQIRVITALTADELEHVGVAAFHPAFHDVDRLAPQARGTAVARLAGRRDSARTVAVDGQQRVRGTRSPAHHGTGVHMVRWPRACNRVRVPSIHYSSRSVPFMTGERDHVLVSYSPAAVLIVSPEPKCGPPPVL